MTKDDDLKYMGACLRYAQRHCGLTGTNPSVGTLLVKDGKVIGKGVTAKGGRPHAERQALDQAGESAKGATAYVSLEPCAHHGATPPCAQTLINAGVSRVVTSWIDPDRRVDGKGHAMLREAGIAVETGILSSVAEENLSGYLSRKVKNKPQVIVKLAISRNKNLGILGEETTITSPLSKAYVHRMRAEYDAILVGRGTAECDDPELTCRLPGLEGRSPHRFVLDTHAKMSPESNLAQSAHLVPVSLVTKRDAIPEKLTALGVKHFGADTVDGKIALPEILEDMAALGISTLMVEGGAEIVTSFLIEDLVDEMFLFSSPLVLGAGAISSPINPDKLPEGFKLARTLSLGDDQLNVFRRS